MHHATRGVRVVDALGSQLSALTKSCKGATFSSSYSKIDAFVLSRIVYRKTPATPSTTIPTSKPPSPAPTPKPVKRRKDIEIIDETIKWHTWFNTSGDDTIPNRPTDDTPTPSELFDSDERGSNGPSPRARTSPWPDINYRTHANIIGEYHPPSQQMILQYPALPHHNYDPSAHAIPLHHGSPDVHGVDPTNDKYHVLHNYGYEPHWNSPGSYNSVLSTNPATITPDYAPRHPYHVPFASPYLHLDIPPSTPRETTENYQYLNGGATGEEHRMPQVLSQHMARVPQFTNPHQHHQRDHSDRQPTGF
jgi:hypothetical protein